MMDSSEEFREEVETEFACYAIMMHGLLEKGHDPMLSAVAAALKLKDAFAGYMGAWAEDMRQCARAPDNTERQYLTVMMVAALLELEARGREAPGSGGIIRQCMRPEEIEQMRGMRRRLVAGSKQSRTPMMLLIAFVLIVFGVLVAYDVGLGR